MVESESQPQPLLLPPPPPPQPVSASVETGAGKDGINGAVRNGGFFQRRPKIRVTSEYDSDSAVFFHKISCKLLDSLAKLKVSFQNDGKGEISDTQLAFTSKYLSLNYDVEEQNTLVKGSFDFVPGLQFSAFHDVKAQQGEVSMLADLAGPALKLEVASAVPSVGMPRATLKFPGGEVSLEEKDEDVEEESKKTLSLSGILKHNVLNGMCTAEFQNENLSLRYAFKDGQMAFIPRVSLPSNALSFAFKRRFGPSDKLSYWYNFDSNYWSMVYKRTVGKDFKFKAGYDSEVRLGWASLWVGDEDGSAKSSPMKMKVQFMLQVPQDGIKSSNLMFRVKKRWDI